MTPPGPEIREALGPADMRAVAAIFREYAAAIGEDLEYQGFSQELATLPGRYAPPRGVILMATQDADPVGCAALRPLDTFPGSTPGDVCEMKRLYVAPRAQGTGLGRRLCDRLITAAAARGYRRMVLDTSPAFTAAVRLYGSLGFGTIPRYNDDPHADTLYLGRDLP